MHTSTKSRIALIGIVMILLFTSHLEARPAETTTIIIELNTTGSALWIVESRLILESEEDERFFEEFRKDETLKNDRLSKFREKMNLLLEQIKYSTKRSMDMTDFNIFLGKETTVTNTYGVIRLQFVWDGFAILKGDTIVVGDVFEGGYYLSINEILMFQLPPDYRLVNVSPAPDKQRQTTLLWEGPLNFAAGEPSVTIEKKNGMNSQLEGEDNRDKNELGVELEDESGITLEGEKRTFFWIGGIALGCILIVFLIPILYMRSRSIGSPEKPQDDKKLLVDIIRKKGGAMPQKELSDLTGFSKAKVSLLLKELKKEGVIRKTFKGRENLITLRKD